MRYSVLDHGYVEKITMWGRYISLPDENYVPSIARIMMKGSANKQAASIGAEITEANAFNFQAIVQSINNLTQSDYEAALAMGVPKELARILLPVGRYSKMRASANLRNWLAFLTLRLDPNAQWEIQQYAKAVGDHIATCFPRTWSLFNEERTKA